MPDLIPLTEVQPRGHWDPTRRVGTLTLTYDERYRRRRRLTTDDGVECLLSLPRAVPLGDGDGLTGPHGDVFEVKAAPEPLLCVTAHGPHALMKLAWHLGNRHTPADLQADRILIRPDHVLGEMLEGLGGHVQPVEAPFQPERGAYHDHGGHGHTHDHDHG